MRRLVFASLIPALGTGAFLYSAPAISFNAPRSYLTGAPANSVATADFNGDGIPDMAVTSGADGGTVNIVSIFLGSGHGAFKPPLTYSVGADPAALAIGDFNHDGKLDLATANTGDGTVSILFGHGDGTFQPPVNYSVGRSPCGIAIGDFNHDGNLDLAVVDGSGLSDVDILLGNSAGVFQWEGTYRVGSYPNAVVAADFNGDGITDLAISCGGYNHAGQGIVIMLGKGNGGFEQPVLYAAGPTPASLGTADFNGDGKLDLVVADNGSPGDTLNTLSLLLGNGDGTFQFPLTLHTNGSYPSFLAVANLNGDGLASVAVSTSAGIEFLLGNGNGSFQPARVVTLNGGNFAVADFNGDGELDLAIAAVSLTVLVRQSDGDFPYDSSFYAGGSIYSVASGDFNGDGYSDLVASDSGSASISILLANGDGTFQTPTYYSAPKNAAVRVAALTGSGHPDLVISAGSVAVRLGNGSGQFGAPLATAASGARDAIVADFNLDGKPDLAVTSPGGLQILLGNGDGTFQPPTLNSALADGFSLAAGDFNYDGKPDLVVANVNLGTISILFGNGDGTFQPPVNYSVGTSPYAVVIGHFNASASQDLAVANYGVPFESGTISVLINKGNGTFQPPVNYTVGAGPEFLVTGDFNGDGYADLAVANTWSNAVSVLSGNGDGTFQAPVSFNVPDNPVALAAGLFSAGKTDLAAADTLGVTPLTNTTH